MPRGLYNRMTGYLGRAAHSALGQGSTIKAGMYAGARDVMTGMKGYSALARGGVYGGMAGGAYGAVSDDTSMIGGALMGAGLGGAGMRYGQVYRIANRLGIGGFSTAYEWAVMDAKAGASLVSNTAINGFSALSGGRVGKYFRGGV